MTRYSDYVKNADANIVRYERLTALFVRFCRRCNIDMDTVIDAFIVFCLPRVEVVRYNHMPREVVEYPGISDFVDCVESLGLSKSVWVSFQGACPSNYEDWYHYETVLFERLIEKKKISVKHSSRVQMLHDSLNFVDVLLNLED